MTHKKSATIENYIALKKSVEKGCFGAKENKIIHSTFRINVGRHAGNRES